MLENIVSRNMVVASLTFTASHRGKGETDLGNPISCPLRLPERTFLSSLDT